MCGGSTSSREVRSGWRIDDRPGELQEAGSSAGAIRRLLISIKTVFRASEVADPASHVDIPTLHWRQQKTRERVPSCLRRIAPAPSSLRYAGR